MKTAYPMRPFTVVSRPVHDPLSRKRDRPDTFVFVEIGIADRKVVMAIPAIPQDRRASPRRARATDKREGVTPCPVALSACFISPWSLYEDPGPAYAAAVVEGELRQHRSLNTPEVFDLVPVTWFLNQIRDTPCGVNETDSSVAIEQRLITIFENTIRLAQDIPTGQTDGRELS